MYKQYLPYSVTDGLGGILAQEYVARKAHLHRVLGDEGKIPETTQQSGCEIKSYTDYIMHQEITQMSTHVPGFQSSLRFFASFCNGQINHQ